MKYKIAFIYRKSNYFLSGTHFDNCTYNFYFKAMKRNPNIEIDFICDDYEIDLKPLNDKYDALIIYDTTRWGGPDRFLNIEAVTIPKLCMIGDCHDAGYIAPGDTKTRLQKCIEFGFDYYFYQMPARYFYTYYPKEFKYKCIPFGFEKSLYENIKPFNERVMGIILNTGALNPRYYKLRCLCNYLPFVRHGSNITKGVSGDNYVQLLEQFQASIAAMTTTICNKQLEIPAAGCVSFMEVTEQNDAALWGFENGKTAIFIDENNYIDILTDYSKTYMQDKWKIIAENGRKYVLENYTNDLMTNKIVEILDELNGK